MLLLYKNIRGDVSMFCTNCGKKVPDNTRFCIYCGTYLADDNLNNNQNNNMNQGQSIENNNNSNEYGNSINSNNNDFTPYYNESNQTIPIDISKNNPVTRDALQETNSATTYNNLSSNDKLANKKVNKKLGIVFSIVSLIISIIAIVVIILVSKKIGLALGIVSIIFSVISIIVKCPKKLFIPIAILSLISIIIAFIPFSQLPILKSSNKSSINKDFIIGTWKSEEGPELIIDEETFKYLLDPFNDDSDYEEGTCQIYSGSEGLKKAGYSESKINKLLDSYNEDQIITIYATIKTEQKNNIETSAILNPYNYYTFILSDDKTASGVRLKDSTKLHLTKNND